MLASLRLPLCALAHHIILDPLAGATRAEIIRIAEPRQRLSQSNDSSPHLTWILTFAVMICPVHRAHEAYIRRPSA